MRNETDGQKDPLILFVRKGDIEEGDIVVLRSIGVTVVQVKDPNAIKFTRANIEISGNDILREAIKIINNGSSSIARESFSRAIGALIMGAK